VTRHQTRKADSGSARTLREALHFTRGGLGSQRAGGHVCGGREKKKGCGRHLALPQPFSKNKLPVELRRCGVAGRKTHAEQCCAPPCCRLGSIQKIGPPDGNKTWKLDSLKSHGMGRESETVHNHCSLWNRVAYVFFGFRPRNDEANEQAKKAEIPKVSQKCSARDLSGPFYP